MTELTLHAESNEGKWLVTVPSKNIARLCIDYTAALREARELAASHPGNDAYTARIGDHFKSVNVVHTVRQKGA